MTDIFWYMSDRMSPDDENAYTQEEIDNIVGMVSESSFYEDESGMSIDDRMAEVFDSCAPKWSGFQTYEGFCCVNCTGVMHRGAERAEVVLQFSVSEDLDTFMLTGMLIDGVEQPEELIIEFESQFSTDAEYDDDDDGMDYDGFFDEGFTGGSTVPLPDVDPEEYAKWDALVTEALAAEALLHALDDDDDDDYEYDDDDDYVEECGCGHHHHHHDHHHDHDCHDHQEPEEHTAHAHDDDDEDDDYVPDWGDDAAERFWYGSDDDDWQDDE